MDKEKIKIKLPGFNFEIENPSGKTITIVAMILVFFIVLKLLL